MFSKSTIKYIQSLQQKKFRDESRAFVAEGPKVVLELLNSGHFTCNGVYATQEWMEEMGPGLGNRLEGRLHIIRDFELEKIASYSTPNRVVAIFEQRDPMPVIDVSGHTLLLDDIRDPGNFGTIIRTADWFGVENIICSESCVDMYNPKVVQSTMASLGAVNVVYTSLAGWLKTHQDIPRYAAVLGGDAIPAGGLPAEAILVIGNESAGISDEVRALCDHTITISRKGMAESLNAAVATGILLYCFTSA